MNGHPRIKQGVIEAPIGRHPGDRKKMAVVGEAKGRNATTDYKVLRSIGADSLVECALHTGRTHQIRVHMKHLGHPLLGDAVYGFSNTRNPERTFSPTRQMLHAWKLGFFHPNTGEWMQFTSPLPADFVEAGVPDKLE